MGYLERFARNKRRKEKTEVLTARLPESLYSEFKSHCDELGLSISEAVCLLVEREIRDTEGVEEEDEEKKVSAQSSMVHTDKHKRMDSDYESDESELKMYTNRFTIKQWLINGELPCPECNQWVSASNFARHAKQHNSTTPKIFTDERYKEKINEMIQKRIDEK
ncbi:hypothetical protein QYG89_05870 [Bacillus sp. B190/17]|uniref:C2H2-type domain-containing protein n=1 Tax=Bacillus lumedeiriae TaxID=3058829 RepID=A0ABW8I6T2_9BACI